MSDEKQYDNTNRGGYYRLEKAGVRGKQDIDGETYYGTLVPTGRDGKAPSHELYLRSPDGEGDEAICIPLWKNERGFIGGSWKGYFVNVFINADKKNDKAPDVSIVFKPKDAASTASAGQNATAVL